MVVGVTGGVASGKSSAMHFLAELGASVVDTDEIARRITLPGTTLSRSIIKAFGFEYAIDGSDAAIDRSKLGTAIFRDSSLRLKLESMVHPLVIDEMQSQIKSIASHEEGVLIVVEVPLLFEINLTSCFDKVLVIWCTEETQRQRLKTRLPHLDEQQITERINSQMSLDKKRLLADFVVSSELSMELTQLELRKLYGELTGVSVNDK